MLRTALAALVAALVLAAPAAAAPGYRDAGYWAVADRMQTRLDRFWDEGAGYYRFGADGVEPMANSMMLLTHAVAAMSGHEGPARDDHRARVLARRLVSAPPFVERPGSGQRHAPGWVSCRAPASTSCSTPRWWTASSTPTAPGRRSACPSRPSGRSARRSTAPPARGSGAAAARVQAVLRDGSRLTVGGRRLALSRVAYLYIRSERSGYVVVPRTRPAGAAVHVLRPAAQSSDPRPGPTPAIQVARVSRCSRAALAVRLTPVHDEQEATAAAARLARL